MSDLTQSDVQRAVQDATRDIQNQLKQVADAVQRLDANTASSRQQDFDTMRANVDETKVRIQAIENSMQQVASYLQSIDSLLRSDQKDQDMM